MDPVPLSKIGTHLLASLGSKGKNRNPLACLRNAGSYFGVSYCSVSVFGATDFLILRPSRMGHGVCSLSSPHSGASVCSACVGGKYSTNKGASECTNCAAGKYSTATAATSTDTCLDCAAGSYSGAQGASSESLCSACVAGKYGQVLEEGDDDAQELCREICQNPFTID